VIAVDTNLLVRLYVDDGDRQSTRQREISARIIRQADKLFVPKTVLLELEWVLRGFYAFERDDIARAMQHLLGLPNAHIETESVINEALGYYRRGLDFADALHAASSADCEKLLTFDKRFVSRARRLASKTKVAIAT
jgi:predicted nucleic-acid-binding protein